MKLRKRLTSLIVVMVLALGMIGIIPASAASTYSVTVSSAEKYSMAYQVVTLINKERTSRGLTALKMDKALLDSAMQRAAEISFQFDHTRPDGSSCFTAFDWESCAAENIAYGQTSASEVCTAWMNSEGHRQNILTADFKSIGVGCAYIGGTYYWVQVFDGGSAVTVSQPADKAVSRTVKLTSTLAKNYIPSGTPSISSLTTTTTSATIKWGKVTNATGYRVYKYDESSGSYKSLTTVSSTTLSYTDKTVKPGNVAKYKVRAYRKNGSVTGWSSYSAEKSKTIVPVQVSISSASASTTSVRLNWNATTCTGYKIYKYNASTKSYKLVATVGSSTKTYNVTGLSRKTAYKFKIRAYSKTASGSYVYGAYSAVKTVTTK